MPFQILLFLKACMMVHMTINIWLQHFCLYLTHDILHLDIDKFEFFYKNWMEFSFKKLNFFLTEHNNFLFHSYTIKVFHLETSH